MSLLNQSIEQIQGLLDSAVELEHATRHFPSRGQSAVQKLYQTDLGRLFLKQVSDRNHKDCQVNPELGTLAEREQFSFLLAQAIGLHVPELKLVDSMTTVQNWLDFPDAHIYSSNQGPLIIQAENAFECGLFDWVTGQVDRHDANYLYDYVNHKIILIDSAHCFLVYEGSLPHYLQILEAGSKDILNKHIQTPVTNALKSMSLHNLKNLIPLKNKDEMMSLFLRLDQIESVHTIAELIQLYRS